VLKQIAVVVFIRFFRLWQNGCFEEYEVDFEEAADKFRVRDPILLAL